MEMRAAASVGDLGVRRGFVDSVRFLLKALLKASTVIQIFWTGNYLKSVTIYLSTLHCFLNCLVPFLNHEHLEKLLFGVMGIIWIVQRSEFRGLFVFCIRWETHHLFASMQPQRQLIVKFMARWHYYYSKPVLHMKIHPLLNCFAILHIVNLKPSMCYFLPWTGSFALRSGYSSSERWQIFLACQI